MPDCVRLEEARKHGRVRGMTERDDDRDPRLMPFVDPRACDCCRRLFRELIPEDNGSYGVWHRCENCQLLVELWRDSNFPPLEEHA